MYYIKLTSIYICVCMYIYRTNTVQSCDNSKYSKYINSSTTKQNIGYISRSFIFQTLFKLCIIIIIIISYTLFAE